MNKSLLTTRLSQVLMKQPVNQGHVALSLRHYTTTPPQPPPTDSGHNPLLWIGCISLGIAYTYYEKKQGEKQLMASAVEEQPKQNADETI